MARELIERRVSDFASRSIGIFIEDDFGVVTPHTIHLQQPVCPVCARPMPGATTDPTLDPDLVSAAICGEIIKQTDALTPIFEKAGADVTVALANQQERASGNQQASPVSGTPATPTGDAPPVPTGTSGQP